jgi:nitrogenase molybdenum-iron protein alpha chain/nitrogenase molybdenum-cofactor synthesis protein NifE
MTGYIPTQGCELLGAYRIAMALKDCVVMIHGPTGCHFGPNFLEILTNNHSSNGTVSVMRDRSVIYGGIENLEKAIDITRKHYKDRKIIVLSSYIPSIIGDNPEFIDVDVYLDCGGFQPMWQGMEMFLEKLGDFVIREKAKAVDLSKTNLINLVGFQLDVAGGEDDLEEIKRVLALCNISANVIPDTLESLKYAKYASLNVVFV